jgi:hypothetical protein
MARDEEARQILDELVRVEPTPEVFQLAARLWTSFGDPDRAAAVHAEATRTFAAQRPSIHTHD